MESLRHLISFFVKAAVAILLVAVVWWFVNTVSPRKPVVSDSKASSTTKTILSEGWLPSPRKYSSLLNKAKAPDVHTNEYVHGKVFSYENTVVGYSNNNNGQNSYSTHTYSSSGVSGSGTSGANTSSNQNQPAPVSNEPASPRNLTVRNLSIYEGGHVYTGLSFIGEIRSNFFRDGKFSIIVVDQSGKIVGSSFAVAQTDWTVPGWTRFQTKINYPLPNNVACTMIFEEALTQTERATRKPATTSIPIRCN